MMIRHRCVQQGEAGSGGCFLWLTYLFNQIDSLVPDGMCFFSEENLAAMELCLKMIKSLAGSENTNHRNHNSNAALLIEGAETSHVLVSQDE